MPVTILICYAREDEALLNKLKTHLRPLQRQGLIDVWYDREIIAGTEWEQGISEHLSTAQIILLLVSPDFMDSDYCYGIEMTRAIERHESGEARVIPIILRWVIWRETPIGKLQALPKDGKPVKSWSDLDEALNDVAEGIRKAAETLLAQALKVKENQQELLAQPSTVPDNPPVSRIINPLPDAMFDGSDDSSIQASELDAEPKLDIAPEVQQGQAKKEEVPVEANIKYKIQPHENSDVVQTAPIVSTVEEPRQAATEPLIAIPFEPAHTTQSEQEFRVLGAHDTNADDVTSSPSLTFDAPDKPVSSGYEYRIETPLPLLLADSELEHGKSDVLVEDSNGMTEQTEAREPPQPGLETDQSLEQEQEDGHAEPTPSIGVLPLKETIFPTHHGFSSKGKVALFLTLALLVIGGETLLYLTKTPFVAIPSLFSVPPYATLALDDPLRDNSQGNRWEESSSGNGSCKFSHGVYDVRTNTTSQGSGFICLGDATIDFSNFVFEVQISITTTAKNGFMQGGGILFRVDSKRGGYFFTINSDGSYVLFTNDKILTYGNSLVISQGNQTNQVAVVAYGDTITLYVNNQQIVSTHDSTSSHGPIGFEAFNNGRYPTEVGYTNAKVWTL